MLSCSMTPSRETSSALHSSASGWSASWDCMSAMVTGSVLRLLIMVDMTGWAGSLLCRRARSDDDVNVIMVISPVKLMDWFVRPVGRPER